MAPSSISVLDLTSCSSSTRAPRLLPTSYHDAVNALRKRMTLPAYSWTLPLLLPNRS